MDFTNYNTTIIGLDNEDLPVIDKTNKLKEKYNAKG
jgi:hypothetical protein